MRAYFWGNMYLSSIQQGIQAGHVIGNMSTKYHDATSDYYDWARYHKTIILLNGGMSCNLHNIVMHLQDERNPFEWECFCESKEALDQALTSVGIILPEEEYNNAALLRADKFDVRYEDPWKIKLYEFMNSARLAI